MQPLSDVRILAIEQFGAGPWGTLQLSDLGAEVIKIEDPGSGGDVARTVPPFREGEDSLYFEAFNRGKRSISLDLRTPAGRAVFEDLVREVDAVFSNLRGDQPAKLRITYEDLKSLNPRIVCCSLTGFGMTGPRAAEPAYDHVLQAMTGWMALTGEPDGPPTKSGLSLVDYSGGYVAALGLLAGVWQARRTGEGCDVDTSLFETALSLLTYVGTWAASRGYEPERRAESAHPSIVPFQAFQTADGWITVACAKQKFWLALCDALELDDDARFADFEGRAEHREELLALLRPIFRSMTTDEALERLVGVPCGPVNDVLGVLDDPQVEARGSVISYRAPAARRGAPVRGALPAGNDVRARPGAGRGHRGAPARALRLRRLAAGRGALRRGVRLMPSWSDVSAIAARFPGIEEGTSWGTPALEGARQVHLPDAHEPGRARRAGDRHGRPRGACCRATPTSTSRPRTTTATRPCSCGSTRSGWTNWPS